LSSWQIVDATSVVLLQYLTLRQMNGTLHNAA
jgi:hypothetical protein